MRTLALMIGMAAATALGACSSEPKLNNLKAGQSGPDEFSILPTRSLSMPPDLAVLPAPTPGGSNITDPNPQGDAVAALGGNPERLRDQGIGAADQALVAQATRTGTDPGIRQTLATEDARWRSKNGPRLLERVFGSSVYQRAYAPMALDGGSEQLRWQKAGAVSSTSPAPKDQ
ncbi:DUF3035 domain-containing protein [Paracoccus sp. R86501]|uniref:DUF3035 domain-containing protein n=1 Tax=Paracoccus sp. R86501 TaxID=3101711 RepID=UPI0036729E36